MNDINDLINICSKAGKEILKIYKQADKKYLFSTSPIKKTPDNKIGENANKAKKPVAIKIS